MTTIPANALQLRPITLEDADVVATLHAASWRTAYRGILSDAYLAGDVQRERQQFWQTRLTALDDAQFGVLASLGAAAVGFVYLMRDHNPEYGSLVDNLHVASQQRSAGIGPQLLVAAADGIIARRWDTRVHLWVWDANVRAFYVSVLLQTLHRKR